MKKNSVEDENLLGHLEELANSLNIEVRYEQLKKESAFFPGGLCTVKGEDIIIINSRATIDDKIAILSKTLSAFDLSQIYIRPALRELLSNHSFD
jgi:hypothetical protein